MITSFKTQTLNFSKDINDLLYKIDCKISSLTKQKLDAIRFAADSCIDEDQAFMLVKYKELLLAKVNNSICLKHYLVDDIISNVKQYLTVGKLQKFKKSDSITSQDPKVPFTNQNSVQVSINYNYGNYVVHNSISNRYVTETVQDTWDQIDW